MTPSLRIVSTRLRVANLARSLDFYTRQLGFFLVSTERGRDRKPEDSFAQLSTSPDAPPILILEEDRAAQAAPRDAAGLFHAALLFPSDGALGGWLQLAATRGIEFDGLSDHGVSEALYFSDPDGNGLEFYADRPRAKWPMQNGELAMTTLPLALQSLLERAATPDGGPLAGAQWGHLHLRVTDLDRSERFYRETLGLEVMQRSFPGARFLAADGYHHHLGLNTWGHPRQPQPAHALGLAQATFASAGTEAARELRDPDGISLRIESLRRSVAVAK